MERLLEQLARHTLIALDTSIFIYHFEAHPRYQPLTEVVLTGVQDGRWAAVGSTLLVMELTVRPWQLNQPTVAHEYEVLLIHFPHLSLLDATRNIARRAAQLRATYNLRPADALHIATALVSGATAFITNDRGLARLAPILEIIILEDFASTI